MLPGLRDYTLDALVENHPNVKMARKLTREAYALRDQAARYTRARPERGEKRAKRQEAKQMLADARKIEDQVASRLLDSGPGSLRHTDRP